jgi:hypothetical protein
LVAVPVAENKGNVYRLRQQCLDEINVLMSVQTFVLIVGPSRCVAQNEYDTTQLYGVYVSRITYHVSRIPPVELVRIVAVVPPFSFHIYFEIGTCIVWRHDN